MIIVSSPFERMFLKQELKQLSENRKQTGLSWIVYCGFPEEYFQNLVINVNVFLYEKLPGIFTPSAFSCFSSLLHSTPTTPTNGPLMSQMLN